MLAHSQSKLAKGEHFNFCTLGSVWLKPGWLFYVKATVHCKLMKNSLMVGSFAAFIFSCPPPLWG
jgi:hypothetical protein